MNSDIPQILEWKAHFDRWREANRQARDRRGRLTKAYADAALGQGAGPALVEIERVLEMERAADTLAAELDHFARSALSRLSPDANNKAPELDEFEIPAWVRPKPDGK